MDQEESAVVSPTLPSFVPRAPSRPLPNAMVSLLTIGPLKYTNLVFRSQTLLTCFQVELIVDATVAKSIPAPKALSERITQQPKPQPKSAAPKANAASGTRGKGRGGARGGRGGRNPRPAKKTAEELDSEMVDYWQSGATTTEAEGGAAAQPAANGDANMDDEILVGLRDVDQSKSC